jgi:hypothetical protein
MPFTPSHAVVALPFIRTPLVPAAIAVGAMTPDLPLFVRGLPLHYGRTHDLGWLPLTVVLALALLLVWRCVLRPVTRELAPRALAARLPGEWDRGALDGMRETFGVSGERGRGRVPRHALLLAVSLALGVASHIVWDLFTHEGRGGVDLFPALDAQWGALQGYKWLQHGSSALGIAIIGVWMIVWLSRQDAAAPAERVLPAPVRWAWWLSLPVMLAVAWGWGLATFGPVDDEYTPAHLAYQVLPPACAAWGVVTVAIAIAVQVIRARRPA